MQGKIIKGIAGFYYVHVVGSGIYECKAKGIFRKDKVKPLVGDNVIIDLLNETDKLGNIVEIMPRINTLLRPAVANIDQAMVIFAVDHPKPNFNLLDRFMIMMERQQVHTIICFNKADIGSEAEADKLCSIYEKCGCQLLFTSAQEKIGLEAVHDILKGKTTAVAGPSGVGKSSIINLLQPGAGMATGEMSRKIDRGKHTTRHSELIMIEEGTYIMDTPGFSSLLIEDFEKEDLREYFIEFREYEPKCRFKGCMHMNEPDCGVKSALERGLISRIRYDNYAEMFRELRDRRKY